MSPIPFPRAARLLLRAPQSRLYSTPKLAKPARYVPPSHSSRKHLPQDPVNYPGPPTAPNPTKQYPHTFPPPNTWSYFFLTSRRFHFYFSMSLLTILGCITSISSFLRTDPNAGMVYWTWADPAGSIGSLWKAWSTSYKQQSEKVAKEKEEKVDEVVKRARYRKEHGLENKPGLFGLGGWELKKEEDDPREIAKKRAEMEREMAVQEAMRKLEAEKEAVEGVKAVAEEQVAGEEKAEEAEKTEEKKEKKGWW